MHAENYAGALSVVGGSDRVGRARAGCYEDGHVVLAAQDDVLHPTAHEPRTFLTAAGKEFVDGKDDRDAFLVQFAQERLVEPAFALVRLVRQFALAKTKQVFWCVAPLEDILVMLGTDERDRMLACKEFFGSG